MKRLELFEFEDFNWLPIFIRSGITKLIIVLHRFIGTSEVITNLIIEIQKKSHFNQIIDLGSGAGGPMLDVIQRLQSKHTNLELILTDLYPNQTIVKTINNKKLAHVTYSKTALDATNVNEVSQGLKTMIASFHHMKPNIAKKILKSAQDSNSPILIYEIAKNTIPTLIWWLLLPISLLILMVMSLVMTLFVKPLSLAQIVSTYLIPIIPIIYAWDGQASLMRTYTFKDVKTLLPEKDEKNYEWIIADAQKLNGKKLGYCIMGYPKMNT
ncbi:hypothetical protein [uncultured Psychroserpens sp.]|uniref:hypothetical protein n=1 Tax=uncultured Psychroserpens sp. TaxID=255436 RepID=UPI00260EEEDC|nr:hypothetical protein [uncultured Psychroserpens sp.]